jgi:hypothetical protein
MIGLSGPLLPLEPSAVNGSYPELEEPTPKEMHLLSPIQGRELLP